jgi:positive regulator of sigma E activity
MIETGRIVNAHRGQATVKLDKSKACFGCMNLECKCTDPQAGAFINAGYSSGLALETGQLVKIEIRSSSLALQGIQAALLPALGFISGFFSAGFLFPAHGEGIEILGGLTLMTAAGAGFFLFRRKHPAKTPARVIAIL